MLDLRLCRLVVLEEVAGGIRVGRGESPCKYWLKTIALDNNSDPKRY